MISSVSKKYAISHKWLYVAYCVLFINSYAAWLKFNPLSVNLTMAFAESVLVFIILMRPIFKYGCIKLSCEKKCYSLFNLYVFYTVLLSIYSIIVNTSEIQRSDFSNLWLNIQGMLCCGLVYLMVQPYWFSKIVGFLLKITPWMLALLVIISKPENIGGLYGLILRPIIFVLIFITVMNTKIRILYLTLAISCIIISYIFDARSNIILPIVCLIIGFCINREFLFKCVKPLVWAFVTLPFLLLYLGISGTFNIFEMEQYIKDKSVSEGTITDTRTIVYVEVLSSAINNSYVVWGRGIGRGYESTFQEGRSSDNRNATALSSSERDSEVGIHNIFTWGGIVYVIIYTLMWCSVLYYGVYKSSNRYVRAIGFYLAFYYFYSWIENFQGFSIIFISSWFMVALCLSPYFRKMDDREFKSFLTNLFRNVNINRAK